MQTAPVEKKMRTCPCGHDRTHALVNAERAYGVWALVTLFSGASATPKKVTFRCVRCGEVVEATRDPRILAQHRS